jgi:RND family efflux transporter MFP subunit
METENLKTPQSAVAGPNHGRAAPPLERRAGRKTALRVVCALIIVGTAAAFMVLRSRGINLQRASEPALTVAAARVIRQDVYDEVPIPAEFRPYVESELHAMVTGYVSQMNVDFGDKVKQGQILATLEVPELTDQLHNAEAEQQQAEADYANAHQIYTRLQEVNQQHPKLVAQQDIDTAQSKDASSAGAIAAAKANVEKYQTLVNYTKIVAPFDGVITQRSADPGALVQAGTSSDRSMPLVRVSDNYHLRLDFPVSVEYVKDVHIGDQVTVRVDSLGGKTFVGKITRFTDEVNDQTRTMTTEMELDNPNLEIVPGMYAVALFKFEQHSNALTVPTEAISNPKDPVVYVINADDEIEARPVKLGVEMPERYEVTDGLKEGELVMIGSTSQVHPSQKVEPKLVAQPIIP